MYLFAPLEKPYNLLMGLILLYSCCHQFYLHCIIYYVFSLVSYFARIKIFYNCFNKEFEFGIKTVGVLKE